MKHCPIYFIQLSPRNLKNLKWVLEWLIFRQNKNFSFSINNSEKCRILTFFILLFEVKALNFLFVLIKKAVILLSNGFFKFQFLNGKWKEIAFIVLDVLSLTDPNSYLSCDHFTELTVLSFLSDHLLLSSGGLGCRQLK